MPKRLSRLPPEGQRGTVRCRIPCPKHTGRSERPGGCTRRPLCRRDRAKAAWRRMTQFNDRKPLSLKTGRLIACCPLSTRPATAERSTHDKTPSPVSRWHERHGKLRRSAPREKLCYRVGNGSRVPFANVGQVAIPLDGSTTHYLTDVGFVG